MRLSTDEMTSSIFDVDESTFKEHVLDRSSEVPVVVDFWAAWCGPCRVLGPILENLATGAGGSWVLAKVDVDANPSLAAAAGVQGIPAVRAFKDGKQIAEFTGALPEPHVRAWLRQLGPTRADVAVERGLIAEQRGELGDAQRAYEEALTEEPGNDDARLGLSRVKLAQRTEGLDESELRRRVESNGDDLDAVLELADLEAIRGDVDAAAGRLIDVVRSADAEAAERARIHLLELLEALPPDDPRALRARRSLSMALY
ncbi:MAG: tetratricopeptide repeat protein [Actinomycetota bacterium]